MEIISKLHDYLKRYIEYQKKEEFCQRDGKYSNDSNSRKPVKWIFFCENCKIFVCIISKGEIIWKVIVNCNQSWRKKLHLY